MIRYSLLILIIVPFLWTAAEAEEATEPDVTVTASREEFEELGGYGQPQWAERSRASSTTKLYVLSPYEFFAGIISESDLENGTKHELTQEIEVGLPHRFEIDLENHLGVAKRADERSIGIGARYAFAAWDAVPLNPAIAAAYNFGIGRNAGGRGDQPDSYEFRLLVGQEFVPRVQWASNLFFQQEVGGERNCEVGFTQDVNYVVIPDKIGLGVEVRYRHETSRRAGNEFIIGPSGVWKPGRHIVVSGAPLFGCTDDSPAVALFLSISLEFGGGESK